MSEESASAYPTLSDFAGSCFYQDWYDPPDVSTALDAVRDAKASYQPYPDYMAKLIAETQSVVDSDMTDEQIADLWLNGFDAYYLPTADGMTYRAWMTALLDALREPLLQVGCKFR